MELINIIFAFLPVLVLAGAIVYFDVYRLAKPALLIGAFFWGILSLWLTQWVGHPLEKSVSPGVYAMYLGPLLEESLKFAFVLGLFIAGRSKFLIVGMVYGFVVGAGFGVAENGWYSRYMPEGSQGVWIVRGFGTAVMHAGATAIAGSILGGWKQGKSRLAGVICGLLAATVIHSLYNHVLIHPMANTLLVLILVPAVLVVLVRWSEKSLRTWLDAEWDSDVELLALLQETKLPDNRLGSYLKYLRQNVSMEEFANIRELLHLEVELALRAKGDLLKLEAGFTPEPDPQKEMKQSRVVQMKEELGATLLTLLRPILRRYY